MYKTEEERLKEFKEYSGWSFNQIGLMMGGVHFQSVRNWIHKKYTPGLMPQDKIRQFLDTFEGLGKRELRKRLP